MRVPALSHPSAAVFLGDCLDVLAEMPDDSVDAIVTDPPYGLGFMGKAWDDLPPGEPWARECLRVLKPGGHLLAFGGTRTWHRLAVAVEDAGFEVRDSIAWLYGSGFPKSLDVSKAIDKRRTEDQAPTRVVCRAIRAAMDVDGLKSRHLVEHFDGCHPRLIDHWAARDTDSQPAMPTWEQWEALKRVLPALGGDLDAEVWRLNGRKGSPGEAWAARPVTGIHEQPAAGQVWRANNGFDADLSAGKARRDEAHTPAAAQWQGWGTALKPAFEPIVVARKPLVGTVAANVLAHGTGALNIDGCRVSADDAPEGRTRHGGGIPGNGSSYELPAGRWPANVVLDDSAAAELDEQSGTLSSHDTSPGGQFVERNASSLYELGHKHTKRPAGRGDSGGASRFFPVFRYQAKAPTRERPKVDGVAHPTVKPLALMRWLVRLVTPPGGTVLDTFAGSGATVEAAIEEGFYALGIEREETYLPLIEARLDRVEVPGDTDAA